MSESKLRKPYQVPDIISVSFRAERGYVVTSITLEPFVIEEEYRDVEYRIDNGGYFGTQSGGEGNSETWF